MQRYNEFKCCYGLYPWVRLLHGIIFTLNMIARVYVEIELIFARFFSCEKKWFGSQVANGETAETVCKRRWHWPFSSNSCLFIFVFSSFQRIKIPITHYIDRIFKCLEYVSFVKCKQYRPKTLLTLGFRPIICYGAGCECRWLGSNLWSEKTAKKKKNFKNIFVVTSEELRHRNCDDRQQVNVGH